MTKAAIVRALCRAQGQLSRSEAALAVDLLLRVLKERIVERKRVLITNFGSFEVLSRRPRRGRDPVTGDIIEIHPRTTLVFRAAPRLESQLNQRAVAPK